MDQSEWQRKGATLSDASACKEFGLSRDEIVRGIRSGQLHYQESSMQGNPWLRLLRREVEGYAAALHGKEAAATAQRWHTLQQIDRELKRLKREISALESRRANLLSEVGA